MLRTKRTAETWPLFKYENNFQASFSCAYFTPTEKNRTKEKYEELWKPLKLSLSRFRFLVVTVPCDAAIGVFFCRSWHEGSQSSELS